MPHRTPRQLQPRKTPVQARSAATVDALLQATVQVLLTDGAVRLTTTRVAHRAGVSVGTMYQYFPHKNALLHAVIARYLDGVVAAFLAACRRAIGQPVATAADALVTAYIDTKIGDVAVSRALYTASAALEVTEVVRGAFDRLLAITAEVLRRCPDARFDDVEVVAGSLLATVTGATRVMVENEASPASLADFRARMTRMAQAFLHSAATEESQVSDHR